MFNANARAAAEVGYASKRDLKKSVNIFLAEFSCPECGSQKVNGSGVEVSYVLNHLYEEQTKKGLLFSRTKRNKIGNRFEIETIAVKNGVIGFLAGQIKCSQCGWKVKGGSQSRWVSPADLFR